MYKVSVIGGAGHIGLPFSCFMQNMGYKITIIDIDSTALNQIRLGRAPFFEEGLDVALEEALKKGLILESTFDNLKQSDYIVLTIGTSSNIKDKKLFKKIVDDLILKSKAGSNLILRSTIDNESFNYLKKNQKLKDKEIKFAYCPERIAEGYALEEITTLPQIIGVDNDLDYKIFSKFFEKLNIKTLKTSIYNAIFIKLFSNAYRYASFNLINEFSNIAVQNGLDFEDIYNIAKLDYPRLENAPHVGLVGGPCLPKDFQTFQKNYKNKNKLLERFLVTEEYFLDNIVKQCKDYFNSNKIIQLGATFKPESDDIRTSPSLAIYNKLLKEGFEVYLVDPHVKTESKIKLFEYKNIVNITNNIIISTNHKIFLNYDFENKKVLRFGN